MKYALIDMGSNTIRLCVYEVIDSSITKLFQKKVVAGIAGYVENGVLSQNGIQAAIDALKDFNQILGLLDIQKVDVFATASLRNIENQKEALDQITENTGRQIEVLSGKQEAILGYYGLVQEKHPEQGFLVDIGGGSTEITVFSKEGPQSNQSYPIGSLNLYKQHVNGHVFPTKNERDAMYATIGDVFQDAPTRYKGMKNCTLYAVGGSARAILRIANPHFRNEEDNTQIQRKQIKELRKYLEKKGQDRIDLIIKYCPERFHTIIPGLMILETLSKKFGADCIDVCSGGVREGYLLNKKHI